MEQLLLESFRADQTRMKSELEDYQVAYQEFRIKMNTWEALMQAKMMMLSERDRKKKTKAATEGEEVTPAMMQLISRLRGLVGLVCRFICGLWLQAPPLRPARPVILPWLTDEQNWALIKEGQRRMEELAK